MSNNGPAKREPAKSNPRPSFQLAWAAGQRIYSKFDSLGLVASMIGGKVQHNIEKIDAKHRWKNTCAVRMSYILNETGTRIPPSGSKTVSGKDGRFYFYRVKDLIQFLDGIWGKPDVVAERPQHGDASLMKKNGILLFEVDGWGDAIGHATLWRGALPTACYDSCYFNMSEAEYKCTKAHLWELP